jgi:hypothetical protein
LGKRGIECGLNYTMGGPRVKGAAIGLTEICCSRIGKLTVLEQRRKEDGGAEAELSKREIVKSQIKQWCSWV